MPTMKTCAQWNEYYQAIKPPSISYPEGWDTEQVTEMEFIRRWIRYTNVQILPLIWNEVQTHTHT